MNGSKVRIKCVRALSYGVLYIYSISSVFAVEDEENRHELKTVTYEHVLNWSLRLIIVLCIFFICIWFIKKTGSLPNYSKEKMRVLSALSVGMREKLILVQIGNKQLVLGVTPGNIVNLLTLEGDEKLFQEQPDKREVGEFSQKLKQLMKSSVNE